MSYPRSSSTVTSKISCVLHILTPRWRLLLLPLFLSAPDPLSVTGQVPCGVIAWDGSGRRQTSWGLTSNIHYTRHQGAFVRGTKGIRGRSLWYPHPIYFLWSLQNWNSRVSSGLIPLLMAMFLLHQGATLGFYVHLETSSRGRPF